MPRTSNPQRRARSEDWPTMAIALEAEQRQISVFLIVSLVLAGVSVVAATSRRNSIDSRRYQTFWNGSSTVTIEDVSVERDSVHSLLVASQALQLFAMVAHAASGFVVAFFQQNHRVLSGESRFVRLLSWLGDFILLAARMAFMTGVCTLLAASMWPFPWELEWQGVFPAVLAGIVVVVLAIVARAQMFMVLAHQ